MNEYYLTFEQKYRVDPHPSGIAIHPDGYVVIEAASMREARELAFKTFGQRWAFLYEKKEFKFHYFPKGEINRITGGQHESRTEPGSTGTGN